MAAHLDIDSAQRRVYGHAKQGAGFGAAKVGGYTLRLRGLNPLIAAVSTPTCAPVLVGTRLRGGSANSARGAESFTAESITTARDAGATGLLIARMDSAFYAGAPIAACRRADVRFSVTAGMDPKIARAIAGIPDDAWTPIRYPNAIFDEDQQRWISDAEVAEVPYTAFAAKKAHTLTARLIVRRVRRLAPPRQGELLPAWRHHAIFTDSPLLMLAAEADHRDHAIIEQLIADLIAGPLAHLPSGNFAANAAWLTCTGIAHNLLRSAATLASRRHGPRPRRHSPPRTDHHPRPTRAPRTRPADPAPTPTLALAQRVRRPVHHHPPPPTSPRGLITLDPPERTDRRPPRPPPHRPHHTPDTSRNRQRQITHALNQHKRSSLEKTITQN